jgi:hypothetical protein
MAIANRLTNPIAVIGTREEYQHLCRHCGLDPSKNDIFFRPEFPWDLDGKTFSRVLEMPNRAKLQDWRRMTSLARARVRN